MTPEHLLQEELSFFAEHKAEWLAPHEGKFALIKGKELIGTYTKDEEAYEEGVKRFGAAPFLIKQILKNEPTETLPALTAGLIRARL